MSGFLLNPFILATPAGGGDGGGGAYATGGTVVDITGYKVHIFNASGIFATTSSWPSGRTIEYVVVAGGGGAGYGAYDGGGGAGGLLSTTGSTRPKDSNGSSPSGVTAIASTNYAVTVGAGGTHGSSPTNGGDSSFVNTGVVRGGGGKNGNCGNRVGGTYTGTGGGCGGHPVPRPQV